MNAGRHKRIPASPSSARRWCFRLVAGFAIPVLFLLLLELGLRLAGVGYPTSFLLPSENHGAATFVQNNKFTWRYFGPRLARHSQQFSIVRKKDPDTVRIFVFGESAAYGDPQPEFGLPRMIEAFLNLRHPKTRFEVINTGITAINSHVIRDIASDCAKANGDIWVIYMGNNEVVGPCGAGTIFGPQTPPLAMIRAGLALKATRLGQLFDGVRQRFQPASSEPNAWEGMTMFLGSQVAAGDPRMVKTYDYFARNLSDIIRLGHEAGAGVVVSTVAVNLKDCAPFASEHRPGFSGDPLEQWNRSYQSGLKAQEARDYTSASRLFAEAARTDDSFADLRFCQGECALALHDLDEARRQFTAARDLDTLRFRCDTRLNDLIRQTASNRDSERILLADAEQIFARESPDHLAGREFFYEHVHLNFDGNYLLARVITPQIEKLLPARILAKEESGVRWPSEGECARRLAWNPYMRLEGVRSILSRLRNAPFTNQLNHEAQVRSLSLLAQKLAFAAQPAGLRQAEESCEVALAAAPDDTEVNFDLALLKGRLGDVPGAVAALERQVDAIPSDAGGWGNLGIFLSQEQKAAQAANAFEHAVALDPLDASLWQRMAESFWKSGQNKEAERSYRQALAVAPNVGVIWLEFGRFLESSGRKALADDCYQHALLCPGKTLPDFLTLAHFCENHSWYLAASTNYLAAVRLEPSDPELRMAAGDDFALSGSNAEAEEQFRQALVLQPDSVPVHLDLAIALMKESRKAEALSNLDFVLKQEPTNATALQYAAQLRQGKVTAGFAQ